MTNMIRIAVTDKLNFCCLKVSGHDSKNFLQNQFCNDINDLKIGGNMHQFSGYCSPKGRLLATLRVIMCDENNYKVITPLDSAEVLMKRLSMFVLRSHVSIDNVSKTTHFYGIWFDPYLENKLILKLSESKHFRLYFTKNSSGSKLRAWVEASASSVSQLEKELKSYVGAELAISKLPCESWTMSELLAGFTWLKGSQTDRYIPQSINLDLANGMSFTKGCYPGQEVIARLHFLGKKKKRSILASLCEDISVETPWFSGLDISHALLCSDIYIDVTGAAEKQIGEIVSICKKISLESPKTGNLWLLIQVDFEFLVGIQEKNQPKLFFKIEETKYDLKISNSFSFYKTIVSEVKKIAESKT
jgi:folate-binding protein YgfZ